MTPGPCSALGSQAVPSQAVAAEQNLHLSTTAGPVVLGNVREGQAGGMRGDGGWTVQLITLHSLFLFHSRLDSFPVNVLSSSMTKSLSP